MRLNRKRDRMPGIIISIIFFVAVIAFMVLLLYTNLVPLKYIGIIFLTLLILVLLVRVLTLKIRKTIPFIIGAVLTVVVMIIMGVASLYIYKTISSLDKITGVNKEVTALNVYVLQDDKAQTLADTSSYTYGILSELDRENTDTALEQIFTKLGDNIKVTEYSGLTELADGLIKGECQAILLNGGYVDVLDQIDHYTTFSSQVRIISTEKIEKLVERKNPETTVSPNKADASANEQAQEVQDTDEVYTIFISGIDTRGGMTASSLSDVNIILTLNTKTRQILMISTPRDFFVPLSISNGVPDKLTHAGVYGVNVCMDTLEMLYDININYYFRLNFGGFIQIIDELGGITVHSDYDFDTSGFHFNKGDNTVYGEQALAFCRERYSFSEGDRQRGRNQMAVIQGVVNKITSPELLKSYLSIIDSLEGCFETNIPYDVISELVRQQLDKGGNWEVLSYSANGTGDTQKPYSMSQKAYVMIPDQATVDKAKSLMRKVREGVMLSQADVSAN